MKVDVDSLSDLLSGNGSLNRNTIQKFIQGETDSLSDNDQSLPGRMMFKDFITYAVNYICWYFYPFVK